MVLSGMVVRLVRVVRMVRMVRMVNVVRKSDKNIWTYVLIIRTKFRIFVKSLNMSVKTKSRSVLKKYANDPDDKFWLVEESVAGVPASAVFDLIDLTHLNKDFFSGILNISSKTLDRYRKAEKRLAPSASQLMLKLFTLYRKGEEIFGNLEEFQKWIEEPAYGLGSKIPRTLFQTPAGIDLIMDELVRIEYGDLA
jgi:putative toxin-antitoxin system antitoxin component (TIGR02293 family)